MSTSTDNINIVVDTVVLPEVKELMGDLISRVINCTPVSTNISPITATPTLTDPSSTAESNVTDGSVVQLLQFPPAAPPAVSPAATYIHPVSESLAEKLYEKGYDSDGLLPFYENVEYDMERLEKYISKHVGQYWLQLINLT